MILVSWNCRGLGSSLKSNAAWDLIIHEQSDLFLIQETKMFNQDFQTFTKRHKIFAGTTTDSVGASEGIGTLWNKSKWDLTSQKSSNWWVRTDLKYKITKEEYTVLNIYAPNHYRDKAYCWDSINSELQVY